MAKCPQCGGELCEVPRLSKWLNKQQYEATKAGDWYCKQCPDNGRGQTGFCYWWDREIEEAERKACESMCRT